LDDLRSESLKFGGATSDSRPSAAILRCRLGSAGRNQRKPDPVSSPFDKLQSQGFHVESGSVGYCTRVKNLPSHVYEKDVFVYNPKACVEPSGGITDQTPEYSLSYLEKRIENGATFVAFVNPLTDSVEEHNRLYKWIPFMPSLEFTRDKLVWAADFRQYPTADVKYLAPIIVPQNLSIPVMLKLKRPQNTPYKHDVHN